MRINPEAAFYLLKKEKNLESIRNLTNPETWNCFQVAGAKIAAFFRNIIQECCDVDYDRKISKQTNKVIIKLNTNFRAYDNAIDVFINQKRRDGTHDEKILDEWAIRLKEQGKGLKSNIFVLDMDKEFPLENYGFMQDQLEELKAFSSKLLTNAKSTQKMEKLWTNFLAQRAYQKSHQQKLAIAEIISNIEGLETNIQKCNVAVALIEARCNPSTELLERVTTLKSDAETYKKYQDCFHAHLPPLLEQRQIDANQMSQSAIKLSKKLKHSLSQKIMDELVVLNNKADQAWKIVEQEKLIFNLQVAWDLLQLVDLSKISANDKDQCKKMLKNLQKLPIDVQSNLRFTDDVTADDVRGKLIELSGLPALPPKPIAKIIVDPYAQDEAFLNGLEKTFKIVNTTGDGNCLFHAIKCGLTELSGFDHYKNMESIKLRECAYEHMEQNHSQFKESFSIHFQTDIGDYVQMSKEDADEKLLKIASGLHDLYKEERRKYGQLNDKKGWYEEIVKVSQNIVTYNLYADAMKNSTTYVDQLEVALLKSLLKIRIAFYSPVNGNGADKGFLEGPEDYPVVSIARPLYEPHFYALLKKA